MPRDRLTPGPVLLILLCAALYVLGAIVFEYSDDTIASSTHAWLLHGTVSVPLLLAAHLPRRTMSVLLPFVLVWALVWTGYAIPGRGSTVPVGRVVQEVAAPWVPLGMLVLARALAPRPPRPGLCPVCRYDLRASPDRCPECGAPNPKQIPN